MKNNILLINPAINPASQNKVVNRVITNLLPTSLGALAGYLQSSGVDSFRIIDEQLDFLDDLSLDHVINGLEEPRIVGISVLTINSKRAYELADKIKAIDASIFVVLGGIHPSVLPEEALRCGGVDVVVRGEGEKTLFELIRCVLNKEDYRRTMGISYRNGQDLVHNPDRPIILNLDEIPQFPYHLFAKDRDRYECFAAIFTSRGCPHTCTFCSSRNISGTRYRCHSASRIIADIKLLADVYGQKTIWFTDDNIAANRRAFLGLLDAIIAEGLNKKVEFHGSMRGDNATDEILDKAKEANFKMLAFGLETTSESLMKVINKGESVKTVTDAIINTDKRGIAVAATLIFGLPAETREDRRHAMRLINKLPLSSVRFNTLTPYPGTPVFESLKESPRLLIKKDWENFAVQYMWESDDIPYVPEGNDRYELLFDTMYANLSFYLSPAGIRRMLKSSFAGGNVIRLKGVWYLSPKVIWRLSRLFLYLTKRFLYVTVKMVFRAGKDSEVPAKGSVIVTNNRSFLKDRLDRGSRGISYIVIEEDGKNDPVRSHLASLPAARELKAGDLVDERGFTRNYSVFMKGLNEKNASRGWWAMNFTNKNPLLTMLCKNSFDLLLIKNMTESSPGRDIVVVTSNARLARFVGKWAARRGSDPYIKVDTRPDFKLLSLHVPMLFALYNFARLAGRVILSRTAFGLSKGPSKFDCAIITQFMKSSFPGGGKFRDVYFGNLREFIKGEGQSVVTCGFSACRFTDILPDSRNLAADDVYPLERFLTIGSLSKCLAGYIRAVHSRHSINGKALLEGEELIDLVKGETDMAFSSSQVFDNMVVYYAVKDLLSTHDVKKIIYPFENRSWEKMILLAVKDSGKSVKLTGYQHSSLSQKHVNYMLEAGEASHTPLPDEVISMGDVTKGLMKDFFGFPADLVKRGCALRQSAVADCRKQSAVADCRKQSAVASKEPEDSAVGITLLFALASNTEEYVRTLRFIDKAALDKKYIIKIRPHFAISFDEALSIYKPRNFEYTLDDDRDLTGSVTDSDIVLYAAATVGIEALALGRPVIYIDFGNFINSDPLFAFSDFKWAAKDPGSLPGIIDKIRSLDKESLKRKRAAGILYAGRYFTPADSENMKVFL